MISNLKKKISIGIIDYQSGNLSSLINSIKRMNYSVKILKNSKDIHKFNKIILPGVGSFEIATLILLHTPDENWPKGGLLLPYTILIIESKKNERENQFSLVNW